MAKNAISEKAVEVLKYLKANDGANIIADDIVAGTGLTKQTVNGVVTLGLVKKGLAERYPGILSMPDGVEKEVKFIKITDAGRMYDHDEAVRADEAAAATN